MNPVSPVSVDSHQIDCPRCRGAMFLARTRKAIAGRDLQLFECRACSYAQVMSFDPSTAEMTYVLSGARPVR